MEVDIACVGFGPATAGFLTTLSREIMNPDGTPQIESMVSPGLPLQVICYERADVRLRCLRRGHACARNPASFPDLDPSSIPMAAPVKSGEADLSSRSHWSQPSLACIANGGQADPDLQLRAACASIRRWSCRTFRRSCRSMTDWFSDWGSSTSGSASS